MTARPAVASLQQAYAASVGGATPEIVLDPTRGALTIQDNATPLGANLLEVQDNAGGEILSSSLARPLTTRVLSNSDAVHLQIIAKPVATPNIPYGAIEFMGSIDLITTSFNCGLIKSGFFAGSGFDKGYMTFCSPVTIGVWNDVLTIRNNRIGMRTTAPVCAFDLRLAPVSVLWSDGSNRNTSEYHRTDFTSADLTTGLSGLFGVDAVWSGTNSSGRNVNATFFVFTNNGLSHVGGQHHTCMVGQYTVNATGVAFGSSGVGMQGKIRFGTSLSVSPTNVSLGHTAVEAFMQGSVTTTVTAALLFGFKTRPTIGGGNFTVTDLVHMHFTPASGAGTVVNEYGLRIPRLTKGTTTNTAILLDGDGAGSEIQFGDGQDAEIYYDGDDLIIDPDIVGTGRVLIGATGDDDMLLNDIEIDGDLNHDGANIGLHGTAPVAKATITGSRAGNAALANLLTALAARGDFTDSTTA